MSWKKAFTANPYPPGEGLGVIWRCLAGAKRSNPAGVGFTPHASTLNEITPQLTLGLGGDVMSMFGRPLRFDASVHDFFAPCEHVVLNFEGVVTDEPLVFPDQKHTPPILDALREVAEPARLVLGMANNHAGDFGESACRDCATSLERQGFKTFGLCETPFIDLGDHVRVVTGTQWSNREKRHLAWLDTPEQHLRPGAFNLLYPHWGFEMELYPRPSQVDTMRQWLAQFDAVVGHHSHNPQPLTVMSSSEGIRKVAAYSLGDFCFGMSYKRLHTLKYYVWGAVARITLGPLKSDPSRWAVGQLDWRFIECRHLSRREGFAVGLVDQIPLFEVPSSGPA